MQLFSHIITLMPEIFLAKFSGGWWLPRTASALNRVYTKCDLDFEFMWWILHHFPLLIVPSGLADNGHMKVHLLEKAIDGFLTGQLRDNPTDWYWPHAMVLHFHEHWSAPQEGSLKEMYDDCLRSEYSQRWWKRDQYRPKEIMQLLIEADPELATIAWKDLSNDAASLDGRLSRFE